MKLTALFCLLAAPALLSSPTGAINLKTHIHTHQAALLAGSGTKVAGGESANSGTGTTTTATSETSNPCSAYNGYGQGGVCANLSGVWEQHVLRPENPEAPPKETGKRTELTFCCKNRDDDIKVFGTWIDDVTPVTGSGKGTKFDTLTVGQNVFKDVQIYQDTTDTLPIPYMSYIDPDTIPSNTQSNVFFIANLPPKKGGQIQGNTISMMKPSNYKSSTTTSSAN
eukprot:GDKI01036297.1.p1 GENE.GDKI01036297.1~~GDKI01036297.1.p1  ORF type:complete len:225 (-),score=46.26 GDKI01036297.1:154-828(-)